MTTDVKPWPQDLVKFPRTRVVGEIKPHNCDGISDGIRQLVTRFQSRRLLSRSQDPLPRFDVTPQLLTYRQLPGQPTQYEVLAADSGELRAIIAEWRPRGHIRRPQTWYRLRFLITVPQAVEMIPRWKCATQLGNLVEAQIRDKYAMQLGISLPRKSASRAGPDIEHELTEMAEFLRELAAELEAEGY